MVEEDPQKAKWISPEERKYIVTRLAAEHEELARTHGGRKATFLEVMQIGVMWKLIALNFFYQTAISSFVTWLPTLIKDLLQTNMTNVGLFSLLPYIGTMILMLTIGALSDKTGEAQTIRDSAALRTGHQYPDLRSSQEPDLGILRVFGCCRLFPPGSGCTVLDDPSGSYSRANVAGGARGARNALLEIWAGSPVPSWLDGASPSSEALTTA